MHITPVDEHDEQFIAQVAPANWKNPTPAGRYNLVVIGGGTAGLVSATMAAYLGAKVALVERAMLGGDCLVAGCVPSKALLRSARYAADSRKAEHYIGTTWPPSTPEFGAVMKRLRSVRAKISPHDSAARLVDLGIDLFYGDGAFSGPNTVQVAGSTLRFKKAIIACGSRAARPNIPGLDEAGFHTNETIFHVTSLPERLLIVGGGPLGAEMAQAFARLGSHVTIVQKGEDLIPKDDPDARRILSDALRTDGIELLPATEIERVTPAGTERIVTLRGANGVSALRVDAILAATGRVPSVEGIGLEQAGVEFIADRGITVDSRLRTTNRAIFAAGDACLAAKFTHAAEASAKIAVTNALLFGGQTFASLPLPWCTYTDPEIAHVGLHPHEAEERGIASTTLTLSMGDNDRAVTDGEETGFLKITLKKGRDTILGATLVGEHAGEIIGIISLAMHAKLGLGELGKCMYPYPTVAELVKNASAQCQISRLTPTAKWVTRGFFRAVR